MTGAISRYLSLIFAERICFNKCSEKPRKDMTEHKIQIPCLGEKGMHGKKFTITDNDCRCCCTLRENTI